MNLEIDQALVRLFALRTLWALLVMIVTVLLSRWLGRIATAALRRHHSHANATVLLGNVARLAVGISGGLLVLSIYSGEAFAWVLGSLSVAGIVLGLSFQDILKNFIAGVWILVEQPIRIGESIEVAGRSGVVEHIAFRVTWLRAPDGRAVIVPNGELMTETVVNLSRSAGAARRAPESAARYSQEDTTRGERP